MTRPSPYQTSLTLFRQGMDTADIAAHFGCSEATVYNRIHREKEAERDVDGRRERQRAYAREYQRRIRREMREARAGA